MKISVTMLSSYLYCSRKLFLEKVLKLREPLKDSLVLGTVRHEIYDKINSGEEALVSLITDKDHLKELYKKSYLQKTREVIIKNKANITKVKLDLSGVFQKTWPYMEREAVERAENIRKFIEKNNLYGKELWEKLTPKIISELRVSSDSLDLRGIVDRIEVYEEEYVPIEMKTGKAPREGTWEGHRIQTAAYALLLEEKFDTKIKEAFVQYLDINEKRHITINPFMKEEIIELVKKVQELLVKTYLPAYCGSEAKCTKCGLRDKCYDEETLQKLMKEEQKTSKQNI
ncbi:CRISPR-associated protein Cas4 [Candidatus Woesearchaeota archaeon]|nr:CRISPR-associated protein Cas4 [Candidatus Woesearchaeota archaeon]